MRVYVYVVARLYDLQQGGDAELYVHTYTRLCIPVWPYLRAVYLVGAGPASCNASLVYIMCPVAVSI